VQQQVLQLWTGQCSQGCLVAIMQLQDLKHVAMLLQPSLQAAEILHAVLEDDAVCCCCCCLGPGLADMRAGEAVPTRQFLKHHDKYIQGFTRQTKRRRGCSVHVESGHEPMADGVLYAMDNHVMFLIL